MNKFMKKLSEFFSKPQYKITLIYAAFGTFWIFLSDWLMVFITKNPSKTILICKGMIFIVITTILLYLLIRNHSNKTKKTFNTLVESEMKYRELFEKSNEAVLLVELETENHPPRFMDVNEVACKWLGLSREELLTVPPDDMLASAMKINKSELKNEVAIRVGKGFEASFTRKDGSTLNVELYINIIFFGEKRIALVTARDISSLKRIERDLYFMQFAVDKANAGIFIISKNGSIIYANDIQCKRLGYTREELLKLKIGEVGMAAKNWADVFNTIKEKQTYKIYTEHKRKDGSFFPVEVTTNYFEFEGEGYSFGFAVDITERNKAEQALRNSENMYRTLVMTMPDAIMVTDKDFKIKFVSQKTVEMHGYNNANELIGRSNEELFAPEEREKHLKEVRKIILKKGYINNMQYKILKKNGEVFIGESNVTVLKDEKGNFDGLLGVTRDITERKITERNLYFMQFSVNNASEGIYIIKKDGSLAYINDITCKRMGYTKEELLKLNIREVSLNAKEQWTKIWESLENKSTFFTRTEHRRKDGTLIPVEVTANYFEYEGEGYSFAFTVDITERIKADEALRKSENMYRTLVITLPDAVTIVNKDLHITYASQKTAELHGYENTEELIGRHISELYAPEEIKKAEAELKITIEKGYNNDLQYRLLRKDGTDFIGELNLTVLKNDAGEITGFLGTTRDITKRVQMENEIKQSEERYKRIVDNVIDGLVIIGDRRVKYVSERAREIIGYPIEHIMGMREVDMAAPEDKERVLNEIKKSITETKMLPKNLEFWIVREDGTKSYISSRYSPRLENGRLADYYVFITDMTEKRIAEENMRNLMSRLQKSNEELERFASIASHDLKEPLRMVSSYVQLLEKRYKGRLDKDADDFINFAVEGATRMAKLLDDLLTYSRVESGKGKLEKVDLNKVISEVLGNLRMTIDENKAKITYDKLPEVTADEVQIGQVFQNLIGNSIKFHDNKAPEIDIKSSKTGNEWLFSVKDNGIGIDMKYKDKIFIIFQRLHTRAEYPGTGIGLVLCKKIVEKHGGRIWFESEPGKGSTFYFTLPHKLEKLRA